MKRIAFSFILFMALILGYRQVEAADGKAVIDAKKCGDCHKLAGPAVKTIADILKRKAPDLFYAGSKFQEGWLVGFLQKPIQLRPAGTVYLNNIKTNDKGVDEITGVAGCASKLSKDEAEAAAKYLMTLKDANMKTGVIKVGEYSKVKAKKIFGTDEGCNACHKATLRGDEPAGGLSCPTIFNAGDRLNADWVASFIKDPQYWDPKVWMPKRELDDATIELLTQFVMDQKSK